MKKHFASFISLLAAVVSLAAFAVPVVAQAQTAVTCPAGYVCTVIPTTPGCPVGYTCTPVNSGGGSGSGGGGSYASTTGATVAVNGSPTLNLTYDSSHSESALTANYNLTVTAGYSDLYLYTGIAGGSLIDQKGNSAPTTVQVGVAAGEKNNQYGNYTVVPAHQSVQMTVTLTSNPKQLFAGSYHGFLTNLYVFGPDGSPTPQLTVPSNYTNEVAIVGEVSPYIVGFTSSQPFVAGQLVVAQGVRLDTSGGIFIDGVNIGSNAKGDSSNIGFQLPSSLSNGSHSLQIKSITTGASNNVSFQVQSSNGGGTCGYVFSTNIGMPYPLGPSGDVSVGPDVVALQTWLIANGYHIPAIESGKQSKGSYWNQTASALAQYQAAIGVNERYGSYAYAGPLTRQALNSCGGTPTPVPTPTPTTQGTIAVALQPFPADGTQVSKGQSYDVAAYKVLAINSDMALRSISLDFNTRLWLYANTITIRDNTNTIVAQATNLNQSVFTELAVGTDYRIVLPIALNYVLRNGQINNLTVNVSFSSVSDRQPGAISITSMEVRSVDRNGVTDSEIVPLPRSFNYDGATAPSAVCPAGYICTPPGGTTVCPAGYVCTVTYANCPSGYTCYTSTPVTNPTQPPANNNSISFQAVFSKTFNVGSVPSYATLGIAADNNYIAYVNGQYVGTGRPDGSGQGNNNFDNLTSFNVAQYLHTGSNTISITGENYYSSAPSWPDNAFGLLYKLTDAYGNVLASSDGTESIGSATIPGGSAVVLSQPHPWYIRVNGAQWIWDSADPLYATYLAYTGQGQTPPQSAAPVISSLNPTSGPVSTTVAIYGSNFGTNDTILFAGNTYKVNSYNNGSVIYFTVPPSTPVGAYGLSVVNSYDLTQGKNSNTLVFTVIGSQSTSQVPVISGGTSPTQLNVGQTGTWSVNASNPNGGSLSYTVDWGDSCTGICPAALPKIAMYQTSTFTHSYSTPGTYTVTITVMNSTGLTAKTSSTVTVTGVATPPPTVQPSVSASVIDAFSDKVGVWNVWGPGPGRANGNNPYDWHVTGTISNASGKTVSYVTMIMNGIREGWSSSASTNNAFGIQLYPLVMVGPAFQTSGADQTMSIGSNSTHIDLYVQPEDAAGTTFRGATLTVGFTDGTSVTTQIPASSVSIPALTGTTPPTTSPATSSALSASIWDAIRTYYGQ